MYIVYALNLGLFFLSFILRVLISVPAYKLLYPEYFFCSLVIKFQWLNIIFLLFLIIHEIKIDLEFLIISFNHVHIYWQKNLFYNLLYKWFIVSCIMLKVPEIFFFIKNNIKMDNKKNRKKLRKNKNILKLLSSRF